MPQHSGARDARGHQGGAVWCVIGLVLALSGYPAAQDAPRTEFQKLEALVASYTTERRAITGTAPREPGGLVVDRGPSGTPEQARALAEQASEFLTRLKAINTAKLTHGEWLLYGIAESQARTDADNSPDFFWLQSIVTPYLSPLRTLTTPFAAAPLSTPAQRDAYVAALNQLPATMKAYEVRLEQQTEHGVALPTEELRLVTPFIRSFAMAPPKSPFSVAPARLSAMTAEEQAAFQKRVDDVVATMVNPAVERLAAYIDGPYRARTVKSLGLSQYANGPTYYRYLIRMHTGLDLTPQQIHDRGLAEVKRINAVLDGLRVEAGFAGSLEDFKKFLRTDRRFYPTRSEELGERMMAAIRLIEPKMLQYFSMMPKAPYGVRRLAPELEPSMTYGFYNLPDARDPMGYYNYNGLNPETRSLTMVTAIVFHELLPGHHYQMTRLGENEALTGLRKTVRYTAYTEGWGEYSSDLAWEMGVYPDVYAKAGRLGMDLFTSSRLVVDTGMNALGWSRERAMQFMKANTFESDAQIDTESLRYSTDMP
ncbi:MAG: DUF885 domain-containing protein, partial [Vicinamibacterales bacterium]